MLGLVRWLWRLRRRQVAAMVLLALAAASVAAISLLHQVDGVRSSRALHAARPAAITVLVGWSALLPSARQGGHRGGAPSRAALPCHPPAYAAPARSGEADLAGYTPYTSPGDPAELVGYRVEESLSGRWGRCARLSFGAPWHARWTIP